MRLFMSSSLVAALAALCLASATWAADARFTNFRQPANQQYCHHQPNIPHEHCDRNPSPGGGQEPAGGSQVAPGSGQAPAGGGAIPTGLSPGAGAAPSAAGEAPGQGIRPFSGRHLPFTGLDLLLFVLVGLGLVAIGAFVRVGERFRRRLRPARS